eukprot:5745874-Prymnesium_polylepis.3
MRHVPLSNMQCTTEDLGFRLLLFSIGSLARASIGAGFVTSAEKFRHPDLGGRSFFVHVVWPMADVVAKGGIRSCTHWAGTGRVSVMSSE